MSTIRDVAKRCGVSIATVSHVLNNRTTKVSPVTREKVLAAVRELRYRPSAYEDGRQVDRTNNLAVVLGDAYQRPLTTNPYFLHITDGILEAAARRGFSITLFVEVMWKDVSSAVRRSFDGKCDGIIFVAPRHTSAELAVLTQRGVPVLSVGASHGVPGVSSVDIDNVQVGAEATSILLGQGHRRIAYLGGDPYTVSSLQRADGYRNAMLRAGIQPEDLVVVFCSSASPCDLGRDKGRVSPYPYEVPYVHHFVDGWGQHTMRCVLESAMPDVTAVVAWNDALALAAMEFTQQHGIRIPEEISFIAFDAIHVGLGNDLPKLSSFEQPLNEIGQAAANFTVDRVLDPELGDQHLRFSAQYSPGESIGRAPVVTQLA